ncbi:MAG: NTP transferase domain-containing protein [Phycisphaerales bacterium]|nr:NTP transferase domain-containing protein [Phycisphaerales bacterium]
MTAKLKGIILAGGKGTRLDPVTRVVNKHLLPIYDAPMVAYPIAALVEAGVDDIVVVTNPQDIADFRSVLGDGSALGLSSLAFAEQQQAGGIADALLCAEDLVGDQPICVVLGDNILSSTVAPMVKRFAGNPVGARLLLAEVHDPHGLGVVRFETPLVAGGGLPRVIEILEKPSTPPSRHAVIGVYLYGPDVFAVCRSVQPSARGELEITAVNSAYLAKGACSFDVIDGWWTDAGTFEGLHEAATLVAFERKRGSRIGLSRAAG